MSYGIIRVQKFKASAVKGIQIHNRREKESRTNPDIDKDRSQDNLALVDCPDFKQAIQQRLDTLSSSKAVRKDAVVMAQVLVTSGPEYFENMPKEKQRAFFEQSLDFIAARYGRENILSAVVHLDERTPHMHVDLTPIRDGRLTAKTIFTQQEFSSLHTDFHRAVGASWGLLRGETKEAKQYHLDTASYKYKAKLDAMKEELELTRAELTNVKAELAQFQGVRDGTAKALSQAQAWSIEKAQQEVAAKKVLERESQTIDHGHGRSIRMGR